MYTIILYTFLLIPVVLNSQSYSGRIVGVPDGDIILFQIADSTFRVFLYGIDAPEKDQTFGPHTQAYMEKFLWTNAEIQLKRNINQEGIYAVLYIKGKNINIDLVKNGYAWYDKIHSVNGELAISEVRAREKALGLWAGDNPVSPWDFRQGILAKPSPTDGHDEVLICTNNRDKHYHKTYCRELLLCRANVIVILRSQAKELKMKTCKYCY